MRRLVLSSTFAAVGLLALSTFGNHSIRLVYNGSPSAPPGFYWVDDRPPEKGDFVLVRVPEELRTLVDRRGYLPQHVPLIKRVAGVDGDEICRRGEQILVNGKPAAKAKSVDGSGRPMPVWSGCKTLTEGELFVLQRHPQSFDGRYFGPIQSDLVVGRATLLWKRAPR